MTRGGCFISFDGASFTPQTRSVAVGLSLLKPDQLAALDECVAAGGRVDAGAAEGIAAVKKSGGAMVIAGLSREVWSLITSTTFIGARIITEDGITKAVLVDHPTSFSKFTPSGIQAYATADFAKRLRAGLTSHKGETTSMITSELVRKAVEAVKKPKITAAQKSTIDNYVAVLHRDHPQMRAHEIKEHAKGLAEAMGCEPSLGAPYDVDDTGGVPDAALTPEKMARANLLNGFAKVRANPQTIHAAKMDTTPTERGIPAPIMKSISSLPLNDRSSLGKALAAVYELPQKGRPAWAGR